MISEYFADNNKGKAVVNIEKDVYYIEYYDAEGHNFFKEDFPGKSLREVEGIAEDWAQGYHVLFG